MARREPKPRGRAKKGVLVGRNRPTSPRRVETLQNDTRVLNLRMAGLSYADIAREVGFESRQTAQQALKRALDRAHAEQQDLADEYRHILLARLERLHRAYWFQAIGTPAQGTTPAVPPNMKAADRTLRIVAQTMALLGLEPPRGFIPPSNPEDVARQIKTYLDEMEGTMQRADVKEGDE